MLENSFMSYVNGHYKLFIKKLFYVKFFALEGIELIELTF